MNLQETSPVKKKGFTMIELLLSVALIFIMGMMTYPVGISFYRTQVVREAHEGVLGALRKAQGLAQSGKGSTDYGVKLLESSYVLFEGPSYDTRAINEDETYLLSGALTVTGLTEVVFETLTGDPSATGSIAFSVDGRERVVTIFENGRIE